MKQAVSFRLGAGLLALIDAASPDDRTAGLIALAALGAHTIGLPLDALRSNGELAAPLQTTLSTQLRAALLALLAARDTTVIHTYDAPTSAMSRIGAPADDGIESDLFDFGMDV